MKNNNKSRFIMIIVFIFMCGMFLTNIQPVKAALPEACQGKYKLGDPTKCNIGLGKQVISNIKEGNVGGSSTDENVDCSGYLGDFGDILQTIVLGIQVAAIVVTIVLGILDFAKGATSDDGDLKKRATKNFAKRLIALLVILLLPALIKFIVLTFGFVSTNPLCGIV